MSVQIDIVRQVINVQILEDRIVQVSLLDGISVYGNDILIGTGRLLEFIDGSNTTVSVQKVGERLRVMVSSTASGGSGSGDVTGPASSTDSEIVVYSGATGKIIKNSSKVLTTVGGNIVALTNPGAITFLRLNADNTVTTRTAAQFLTDIGATTVGGNIFTVVNPSAIRYLRINADNTVTLLSAADFRVAIGASRSILYKNNVAISAGSTTSETIVDSFLVAGGTLAANDSIDIDLLFSKVNQNSTWVVTIYVNTSSSLVGATQLATLNNGATIRYCRLFRTLWFRNSVSSQTIFVTTGAASNDDYQSSSSEKSNLTIDFSTNQYFIIAIDPNNASDTCYIETSLFEIIRN